MGRETFKLKGMKYAIMVSHRGNGDFHGEWHCPKCERGDASPTRLPDAESARKWARHCVAVHHALVHAE
jgi:hypothetical protein